MAEKRSDKITIADVARLAGVSTATAGRVLGGYGYSREEIRKKVRESAAALDYRPNKLARSLITGKTQTIGVVAGDIQSPFYASILRGIADVARARGFGIILTNSDELANREIEAVELLLEKQVDGLIVAPSDLIGSEHLRAAVLGGCPVVQIDRVVNGLDADSVTVDNAAASRDCITHLLQAGHRRIGIIAELEHLQHGGVPDFIAAVGNGTVRPITLATSWQRLYGYVEAHLRAGLKLDPAMVPRVGTYALAAAKNETLALLQGPHRPTALFTADGLMSSGAMAAISALGLQLPRDLSLVCFDDLDWMTFLQPGITAVAQPLTEMGEEAARLILARIDGSASARQSLILRPALSVRGSVAMIG